MSEKLDLDALERVVTASVVGDEYRRQIIEALYRLRELERASQTGSGEAVAKIVGVDEYGPQIQWSRHWVELNGRTLYVKDEK